MRAVLALALVVICAAGQPVRRAQAADDRPYDAKLLQLTEILGRLHWLRGICGAKEGQLWRDQMKTLLRSEGTSAKRRVKLVKSFNRGYRIFRRTHKTCTNLAVEAMERFMKQGAEIADKLVKDYR